MDMNVPWLEELLGFAVRWPVLVSLLTGGAAGWCLTLVVERYGLPVVHDPVRVRHQKFITFVLNVVLAAVFASMVWHAFVPTQSLIVRLEVSLVAGILTSFLYPIVARLATKRWPDIGSAWGPRE